MSRRDPIARHAMKKIRPIFSCAGNAGAGWRLLDAAIEPIMSSGVLTLDLTLVFWLRKVYRISFASQKLGKR